MSKYAFMCYVRDLPEMVEMVAVTEARLRRGGRPAAADMLVRAYGQLRDDLLKLGKVVAEEGTKELRRQELATRVRPLHAPHGNSLGDALECDLLEPGLMPGSVGIANKEKLDQKVPWWTTNELGSSARIGGTPLFGYFTAGGADSPPDSNQFRQHALFEPATKGVKNPNVGRGEIKNPIPARRFIEKSVGPIDALWRTGVTTARARFESRLKSVAGTWA